MTAHVAEMTTHHESIRHWLEEFSSLVREVDLENARSLFHPDVVGFGTRTEMATSLDKLAAEQWSLIWPHTEGFEFRTAPLHVDLSSDALQACVQALWQSWATVGGKRIHRPGRATILLVRESTDAAWLAKHTHFSRTPPASPAFGEGELAEGQQGV